MDTNGNIAEMEQIFELLTICLSIQVALGLLEQITDFTSICSSRPTENHLLKRTTFHIGLLEQTASV